MDANWELCKEVSATVHGGTPASAEYQRRVARMLYGTGVVESDFRTRRQWGFSWWTTAGAFSFWQIETVSISCSLNFLSRRPALAKAATQFLYGDSRAEDWHTIMSTERILDLLRCCDKAGVLFARLHYFRFPEAIPAALEEQARYWKKYYNTESGSGTVQRYVDVAGPALEKLGE